MVHFFKINTLRPGQNDWHFIDDNLLVANYIFIHFYMKFISCGSSRWYITISTGHCSVPNKWQAIGETVWFYDCYISIMGISTLISDDIFYWIQDLISIIVNFKLMRQNLLVFLIGLSSLSEHRNPSYRHVIHHDNFSEFINEFNWKQEYRYYQFIITGLLFQELIFISWNYTLLLLATISFKCILVIKVACYCYIFFFQHMFFAISELGEKYGEKTCNKYYRSSIRGLTIIWAFICY